MKLPTPIIVVGTIAALTLFVCALQSPGLTARMYYDSAARLEFKAPIYQWEGLPGAISTFPQRPLAIASFYANYLIGGMNPLYFRIVNLVLSAATAFVVMLIIGMLLDLPGPWADLTPGAKKTLSALLGVVFLAHPFQTYMTLYVWQRMALMSCLFTFLALAAYLAVRSGRLENKILGYAVCLVFFVCAMLSKENGVILPAALVSAEIALFRSSARRVLAVSVLVLAVTALTLAALSLLQHPHGKESLGSGFLSTIAAYYEESGVSLMDALLTQCRVTFYYISVLLFPSAGRAALVSPFVISRSITSPWTTAAAVAGMAGLIAATVYLIRKRPLSGFGLAFFLIGLAPEAVFVPQFAYFGYRAVLPMLGVLIVVADTASAALISLRSQSVDGILSKAVYLILGIWIVACCYSTVHRAVVWSDPVGFWREVVERLQENNKNIERIPASHALNNLGVLLQAEGKYEEGLSYIKRAVELYPEKATLNSSLGTALMRTGKPAEAAIDLCVDICVYTISAPTRRMG
jgi:hypothetical protein